MTEPDVAPASFRWTGLIPVVGVLALAGLLGSTVVRSSEIWMHFATGRAISEGAYTFGHDPFSFASSDRYWVNHSWAFDLVLHGIHRAWGGAGVVFTRALVAICIAIVLLSIRRRGFGMSLPAFGAAIALVAINSRLPHWQPAVMSYLFLAILIWLLNRGGRWLPLTVGLLTAAWVNVDAFFVLAPFTVVLWLIGSILPGSSNRASTGILAATLVASLLGGLASPHHLHAYTIPDELVPSFFADDIRSDRFFESYLATPFDGDYSRRVGPAPAFALFVLFGLGIVGFAIGVFRISAWQPLLVWLGFAALAAWRWRMAPYFAIAGTPLAVLTLQRLVPLQPLHSAARLIGIAARGFSVLGIAGLVLATWPGWLGPRPNDPFTSYGVNPQIVPDAGLEQLAKDIAQAIAEKRLEVGERIAHPNLDVAHYLAWHAPAAKSFVDSRWRLFEPVVGDLLALRRGLFAQGDSEAILKKYSARSVVINGPAIQAFRAARLLWLEPKRWPFRAFAGRSMLFGWVDPASGADPRGGFQVDLARRAYAPQDPLPRDSALRDPQEPSFWDLYRRRVVAPSVELANGEVYLELAQMALTLQSEYDTGAQLWGRISSAGNGATIALGGSPLDPLALLQLAATGMTGSQVFGKPDPENDRWAAPLLAVRSLRAAQAVTPDDPNVYLYLAAAYQLLPSARGLSQFQMATALQQADARIPVAAVWGLPTTEMKFKTADGLAGYFLGTGQLDAGLDSAKRSLDLFPNVVGSLISPQSAEREYRSRAGNLEQLEKQLQKRRDDYELRAEKQPANGRMYLAQQFGLSNEALSVMQKALSAREVIDPAQSIDLLIRQGRTEDARAILLSERHHPVSVLPAERRPQFRGLNLLASAALGDYPEAQMYAQGVLDDTRAMSATANAMAATTIASLAWAYDPLVAPSLSRLATLEYWFKSVQAPQQVQLQAMEWNMWRGMLALESGDTRVARHVFDAMAQNWPRGLRRSQQQEVVDRYRALLDQFAK